MKQSTSPPLPQPKARRIIQSVWWHKRFSTARDVLHLFAQQLDSQLHSRAIHLRLIGRQFLTPSY
ncbi:hypothetical protein HK100_006627 [Physocladia obscura]|uniref:Uncharacterized protein n=1 Tax=Physocladia obscura TaxID=109957 RepID=A0AAD5XIX8_9FUNG|nr:hypothetical protein HK100_006627 [Physocladia obscura]